MSNMATFPTHTKKYAEQLGKKAEAAFKLGAQTGANFMRERIEKDSIPLTIWHRGKNEANGFSLGARIGSKIEYGGYAADPHSGLMLKSVERGTVEKTQSKIEVSFGWLDVKKEYFGKQDTGTYRAGGIGMGLLNHANGAQGMSAYLRSREVTISQMKKAGFGVKGIGSL